MAIHFIHCYVITNSHKNRCILHVAKNRTDDNKQANKASKNHSASAPASVSASSS